MEIIFEGDMDRVIERHFSCKRCGCIFLAKEREYMTGALNNRITYWTRCPCCKQIVIDPITDPIE